MIWIPKYEELYLIVCEIRILITINEILICQQFYNLSQWGNQSVIFYVFIEDVSGICVRELKFQNKIPNDFCNIAIGCQF